jgi:hypothetical protein
MLLAGCDAGTINTGGVEGVIFPAGQAGANGLAFPTTWTPSESDIAAAGPRIEAFLKSSAPSLASRLPKYRCQYFGITVEGKQRIYCNFFARDAGFRDWKSRHVFVLDGGHQYFQLQYDVESSQCMYLMINGDA